MDEGQKETVTCCYMVKTLKTKASSFGVYSSLHWKPEKCSE